MSAITQDKLIEYVLGECDETERRMIEQEINNSTRLQKLLAGLSDSFALPGLASARMEPDPGLGKRLSQSVEDQFSFAGFIDRLMVFLDLPKTEVEEILADVAQCEQSWKSSHVAGILEQPLQAGPRHTDAQCTMFRLQAGAMIPNHSHQDDEWGFILQGEAVEDNGKVYKPGDMVYKSSNSHHTVTAGNNEPLILIVIHRGISFTHG